MGNFPTRLSLFHLAEAGFFPLNGKESTLVDGGLMDDMKTGLTRRCLRRVIKD